MKMYEKIQEILSNAALGAHPAHGGKGRFWEASLDDFKQLVIYDQKLIANPGPDRGARSALIKALRGEKPFDDSVFNRMPAGLPAVTPENIQFIQSWIDADLPDQDIAVKAYAQGVTTPTVVRLTQTNAVRNATNQPRIRKNINRLSAQELANYKSAIAQIKDLPVSDKRSFEYWAGIHGRGDCRHANQIFLPWHRAYLVEFENVLRQFVPSVTIPYWDWVNDREIPEAFKGDETNPLYDAKRYPGTRSYMPTRAEWDKTQNAPTWKIYGGAEHLYGVNELVTHNPMHGWIGGEGGNMTYSSTAAYDPIFWSFHGSVDRQWDLWQKEHPGLGPTTQLDYVLDGLTMKIEDVLTVDQLNYEYAASESLVVLDNNVSYTNVSITGGISPTSAIVASTISRVKPTEYTHGMTTLQFHQVKHPKESYTVYIFVNQLDADRDTPIENNPNYAGRFSIWGHGECIGGKGHCDVPTNARAQGIRHHLLPFDIEHDLSQCVARLGAYGSNLDVSLVVKVMGAANADTSTGGLQCDQISIVSRV